MRKLLLVLLPVLLIGVVACEPVFIGSGHVVTESRNVSGVTAVRLMTSGNLTIEVGSQESLTIEADDNILPQLTSDVINGTLELGTRPMTSLNLHNPIRYHLVVKSIQGLSIMGSGDVTAAAFSGDQVSIVVMGSGNTRIDKLEAKSLSITIEGSGDVSIASGNADSGTVRVLGSGNVDAGNVKLGDANVTVMGSGDTQLWAVTALDVSFMGSGDVRYFGQPKISETHAGSGNLISLGNK